MSKIAARAKALEFSPIRKLVPLAIAAKKRGIKIYHLNIGQPDIASPKLFLDGVKKFSDKIVAYEKSDGNEDLKQSLIKYHRRLGVKFVSSDLVVTFGGSEALAWAFFILFAAGDECLTLDPTYTNYLTFAAQGGVKLKPVLTKLADNFQIPPLSVIKKAVTKKTKGIIITNPSNPTGSVYDPKLLSALVDFCVKKKLFIIADETYREFVYGQSKFRSLLTFKKAEQLVVSADSFSKRYSLCGARLGLLASKNKAVMEAANKLAQSRLAVATIDQMAASKLHLVPQSYFKKIKTEYVGRRDELMQGLSRIDGVTFSRPDGAFYLIAELPVANAEDFCKFMLNKFNHHKETVMLAPAEGFYVTPGMGRNQVRIAYVLNRRDLKRACELIRLGLSAYPG